MNPGPPPTTPRFAVYFRAPDGDPLTALGDRWLGRSPSGAEVPDEPPVADPATVWRNWVAMPRRYGFHATLKPPFRLARGRDVPALQEALDDFARARQPFETEPLRLRRIGRFLAMGFERADSTVEALAAGCVEAFDGFRQPASEEEMARRRATGLSPCQDALLLRWGYPYVMEEFRFHMTLTGPLAEGDLDRAEAVLEDLFAEQFGRRLQVCDICLFEQPGPDAPFRVLSRHPFSLGP